MAKQNRTKIGLALASGGARGAAHAGVLKVLAQEGIPISAVSGSSIGAVVGGSYAAGLSPERIKEEWLNTDLPKVVRSFLPTFPRAGLSSGSGLRSYLRSALGDIRIEDLPVPFAAVACDIDTGEAVVLREGPLVDALRASSAIPGIFPPLRWGDRFLVDGGLVEPLPVRACRDLGAEIVIGVDIVPVPRPLSAERHRPGRRLPARLGKESSARTLAAATVARLRDEAFGEQPGAGRSVPGIYRILNQAVAILEQEILHLKLALWPADLLVRPDLSSVGVSYLHAAEGVRAGETAMEASLPALRLLIEQATRAAESER
ncbi:MAG TPA: patatin-like phospholipase family protein [Candidatus Bipolaricaulis anaerobius]|nr:patatin-like phospholipase family protein [Candidatus Bipolaricaulis anaerobius]HNS23894.1 patatin-like phospholipase family protein [Candidatus Bipolaricaulis anaerobius]